MNMFMIDGARRPPRMGSLAIMSGTLLCIAAAGPALSADYPEYERPYPPRYEYYVPRYGDRDLDRGCYRCSCCGGPRYAPVVERPVVERVPVPVVEEPRPVVERVPVAERHWVQRDYIERRFPAGSTERYSYPPRYSYSYYYPRPRSEEPYRSGPPGGEPPPRYSGDYPPAPVTYEYEAPRPRYVEPPPRELRPAYEYEPPLPPPPRNAYEYERAPRPPATVPSGYYYFPGHAE